MRSLGKPVGGRVVVADVGVDVLQIVFYAILFGIAAGFHGDHQSGRTVFERILSDAGHAVGNGNGCQPGAAVERAKPDAGDAVRDDNGGEAGAAVERAVSDAGDAVGDGNGSKAGAIDERVFPDTGDAVGDGDGGEAAAISFFIGSASFPR